MKRICIFCGSSPGAKPEYVEAGIALGRFMARHGIGVVYGGSNVGVMGALANATLEEDGEVIGIIPRAFAEKVGHGNLTQYRVVDTMHERKAIMYNLCDGFIALPGGTGTLEEFLEALTWLQLGFHNKPCGILNVCNFFDDLLRFLDFIVDQRFLKPVHRDMVLVDRDPERLIERMRTYQAPVVDKWMDRESRIP